MFPIQTEDLFLDITDVYEDVIDRGEKAALAIDISIQNHVSIIAVNSSDWDEAKIRIDALDDSIRHRLKLYTKCITKSTKSYFNYILETYMRRLQNDVKKALRERD